VTQSQWVGCSFCAECIIILLFEEIAVSNGEARVVTLKEYADGSPVTEANFHIETRTLADLAEGDLLLETLELSPDAGMRGRMTGVDNFFVTQLPLGEVISGFGVARVLKSRNPAYPEGEVVYGSIDWADRAVWGSAGGDNVFKVAGGDAGLTPVSPHARPYARALDVVGITGLTAYFGVTEIGKPMAGETFLISAAAGSIGSIAGQIAKLRGARVIGIAGGANKCKVLTERLGFDAAIDYKSGDLDARLRELMPNGPDIYYDNVGGEISQTIMWQMKYPARIVECRQISTYDDKGGGWMTDIRPVHINCLQWTGVTPMTFIDYFPGALAQLGYWLQSGRIIAVYNGIENAPKAFVGVLRGENIGKMVIHLAD
jgi:NADPH-dependent curcumin reductase CurA